MSDRDMDGRDVVNLGVVLQASDVGPSKIVSLAMVDGCIDSLQ